MPESVFIYALCEPGTRTIRYVGKARRLEKRLREHLNTSIKEKSHLGTWLRSLSQPPTQITLSEIPSGQWIEEEVRFVRAARMLGMDLVNGTEGGPGGPVLKGRKHPQFRRDRTKRAKLHALRLWEEANRKRRERRSR